MVALVRPRRLDFAAELPDTARQAIKALLAEEPTATRKIYAALARKVWSLLVERRLDAEVRDWHGLLEGVRAHVRDADMAVAERVTALADLLRESISLAETSPAREVAQRPRARAILEVLQRQRGFVVRSKLKQELGIGESHLSNVLTQLLMHGLIERRDRGKQAEFKITAHAIEILSPETAATSAHDKMIEAILGSHARSATLHPAVPVSPHGDLERLIWNMHIIRAPDGRSRIPVPGNMVDTTSSVMTPATLSVGRVRSTVRQRAVA